MTQVNGIILNKSTLEPVPYANISIENTMLGTTSDIHGKFQLPNLKPQERLVISSVGYAETRITVTETKMEILLQPRVYELGDIIIRPEGKPDILRVNKIRRRNSSNHFICTGSPWISARYFSGEQENQSNLLVKEIKVLARSKTQNAKFNIRILSCNEKGEPSNDLLKENLIATAKKGEHIASVTIDSLRIGIPEDGFFVALEWLIIDDNKYERSYTKKGEKKKYKEFRYNPDFAAFPRKGSRNTWTYGGGNWKQNSFEKYMPDGKYLDLAIELVLID